MKKVDERHVKELDRKLGELQSMLKRPPPLIQCCQGDERLDCSILDDLESFVPERPAWRGAASRENLAGGA